jgi:hypothetical protein
MPEISDAQVWSLSLCRRLVPSFATIPHLVLRRDSEAWREIAHITGTAPGPWPLRPPRCQGGDLGCDAECLLSAWCLPANQADLPAICGGTDFDVLLNCKVDEQVLSRFIPVTGLEDTDRIWEVVPELVKECSWIAVPTTECVFIIFICIRDREKWVSELKSWAENRGKKWGCFVMSHEGLFCEGPLSQEGLDPSWRATVALVSKGVLDPRLWPIAGDKSAEGV